MHTDFWALVKGNRNKVNKNISAHVRMKSGIEISPVMVVRGTWYELGYLRVKSYFNTEYQTNILKYAAQNDHCGDY